MNKKAIVERVLGEYPHLLRIRKGYNQKRLDYYRSRCVPENEVVSVGQDPEKEIELIEAYRKKWPDAVARNAKDIDKILARGLREDQKTDAEEIRRKMAFCFCAYGFEADECLCYHLEQRDHEGRKGYVSERDLMQYVYRMNDRVDITVFNDKAKTYARFHDYYGRDAVSISTQADYPAYAAFVKKHPVFVKKAVFEAMGRSVELVDAGPDEASQRRLFETLIGRGKHILEEKVIQSSTFAALNESSVNTIRVITFYTRHGVITPYCFMKIGRAGSFVDNGGAGGILVGIDNETGKLNTDGFDENNTRYTAHPDSGVVFQGYQLPAFKEALELAKKLSETIPSVKFVGWDMTHTEHGWVVIEGNGMSQLIGPQIVREMGVKAEVEKIMQDMDLMI